MTNIHTIIEDLVRHSVLLSGKIKKRLLAQIPSLAPNQCESLREALLAEDATLLQLLGAALDRAVAMENQDFLDQIDAWTKAAQKKLNEAETSVERSDAEKIFDITN